MENNTAILNELRKRGYGDKPEFKELERRYSTDLSTNRQRLPGLNYGSPEEIAKVEKTANAATELATEFDVPVEDAYQFESYEPGLYKKTLWQIQDKTKEFLGYDFWGSAGQRVSELASHASKIRNVALYNTAAYWSGRSLGIADVIANKAFDDKDFASTVARLSGFDPDDTDEKAADMMHFFGGLRSVGGPMTKLVSKIPAAKALQHILASGLSFGTVEATNQFTKNVTEGKPVDWSEIHHQSAIGTLFGAGEVAVVGTATGVIKGMNEAYKAAMRAQHGRIAEVHQVAADARYTAEYYRKYRRMPDEMIKKYGPSIPKIKPAEGVTVDGKPIEQGKLPGQEDVIKSTVAGKREPKPEFWRDPPIRPAMPLSRQIPLASSATVAEQEAAKAAESLENKAYKKRVDLARQSVKSHPVYVDMLASFQSMMTNLQLPSKINFGKLTEDALQATQGDQKLRDVVGRNGEGKPFDMIYEDMFGELGESAGDIQAFRDPHSYFEYFGDFYAGGTVDKFNRWALEQASKNTEFMLEMARYQMTLDGLNPAEIDEQISLMEKQIYGEPTADIEAQVSENSKGIEDYETETGLDPTDEEADAIISGFLDDIRGHNPEVDIDLGESIKVSDGTHIDDYLEPGDSVYMDELRDLDAAQFDSQESYFEAVQNLREKHNEAIRQSGISSGKSLATLTNEELNLLYEQKQAEVDAYIEKLEETGMSLDDTFDDKGVIALNEERDFIGKEMSLRYSSAVDISLKDAGVDDIEIRNKIAKYTFNTNLSIYQSLANLENMLSPKNIEKTTRQLARDLHTEFSHKENLDPDGVLNPNTSGLHPKQRELRVKKFADMASNALNSLKNRLMEPTISSPSDAGAGKLAPVGESATAETKHKRSIVHVPETELEWGSRQKKGRIGKTLSTSVIDDGKIKGYFEHDGKMWVATGASTNNKIYANQIIPIEEYSGKIYNKKNPKPRFEKDDSSPFYQGISVKYKNKEYVFTGEELEFRSKPSNITDDTSLRLFEIEDRMQDINNRIADDNQNKLEDSGYKGLSTKELEKLKKEYDKLQRESVKLNNVSTIVNEIKKPRRGQKNAGFVDLSGASDVVRQAGEGILDYSRDVYNYWKQRAQELQFFPNCPMEFRNDVRTMLIGAMPRASSKVLGEIVPALLNGVKAKDVEDAFEYLWVRDELQRAKDGIGNPDIAIQDIEVNLGSIEASLSPEAKNLAESVRIVQDAYTRSAIDRGLLDEDGAHADYLRHYVEDYNPEWRFNKTTFGKNLREPVRGYAMSAHGTTKEHYRTKEAVFFSWLEMEVDNSIHDFIVYEADKYDLMNTLSDTDKKIVLGLNAKLKFNAVKPGKIYEFQGKKYRGWCPEAPFNRNFYKNENGDVVMAGYKKTYLLPMEIRDSFERMSTPGNPVIAGLNKMTRYWKSMAIASHYTSYNLNNIIGDTWMAMVQHPKPMSLVRSYSPAIRYLLGQWGTGSRKALFEEFNKFVIDNDILKGASSISEIASFARSPGAMSKLLAKMQAFSEFREGINRAAYAWSCFMEYKAGNGAEMVGAHSWIDTGGISTDYKALGKISRDVEVDYQWNSKDWQRLVSGFAAPFATWYFKASKNTWKWYARNLGKGTAILMALPLLSTMWNNRSDETQEIERNLPDSVRNGTHFILGDTGYGSYNILRLQTPQDAMIGFKVFTIATSYANRVANGEMGVKEAAVSTLKEWLGKEAKGAAMLTLPIARFLWGMSTTDNKDPYDKTDIYRRDPRTMTDGEKAWDVVLYGTRCLLPMLSYQVMAYEKGMPQSSAVKDFMSTMAGKRAFGIYEIKPNTEISFTLDNGKKITLDWDTNSKIEWIYKKTSAILGRFETEYVNSGLLPNEFFKTDAAKKPLVEVYDFWAKLMKSPKTEPTEEQKVEFVVSKLDKQIFNRLASPTSIDRWYKVAIFNAKNDEEKKKLVERHRKLSEWKLMDALEKKPAAFSSIIIGKELEGTDIPVEILWEMP